MFLFFVGLTIFVVWFYLLFLREWLIAIWPDTFSRIREVEDYLWRNSRTILIGRLTWVLGIITALHEWAAASGFDLTPITDQIAELLPEGYRKFIPLIISVTFMGVGFIFEQLKKTSVDTVEGG